MSAFQIHNPPNSTTGEIPQDPALHAEIKIAPTEQKGKEFEPFETPELPLLQRNVLPKTIKFHTQFAIHLLKTYVEFVLLPGIAHLYSPSFDDMGRKDFHSNFIEIFKEIRGLCMISKKGSEQKIFSEQIYNDLFPLIKIGLEQIEFPNSTIEYRIHFPSKNSFFEDMFSSLYHLFPESPETQKLLGDMWGNYPLPLLENSSIKETLDKHPYTQRLFVLIPTDSSIPQELVTALQDKPEITSLQICVRENLSPDTLQNLRNFLQNNKTIEELHVRSKNQEALVAIFQGLTFNSSLTKLEIDGEKIEKESLKAFSNMLSDHVSLSELVLKCSQILDPDNLFARALANNQHIRSLSISGARLSGQNFLKTLCNELKNNKSLTQINMSSYQMVSAEDLTALQKLLEHHLNLQSIHFTDKKIERDAVLKFIKNINASKSIIEFILAKYKDRNNDVFLKLVTQIVPKTKELHIHKEKNKDQIYLINPGEDGQEKKLTIDISYLIPYT